MQPFSSVATERRKEGWENQCARSGLLLAPKSYWRYNSSLSILHVVFHCKKTTYLSIYYLYLPELAQTGFPGQLWGIPGPTQECHPSSSPCSRHPQVEEGRLCDGCTTESPDGNKHQKTNVQCTLVILGHWPNYHISVVCVVEFSTFFKMAAFTLGRGTGSSSPSSSIPKSAK